MNIKHHDITWETISSLACTLALQLEEKDDFDTIICIGRGGMVPARLLSERLDVPDIQICKCSSYVGVCKQAEVKIEDTLKNLKGKIVLVVDDCMTSGKTIDAVYKLLVNKKVERVYIAVLYKNIHANGYPVTFAAAYDANKEWLVFPWENR